MYLYRCEFTFLQSGFQFTFSPNREKRNEKDNGVQTWKCRQAYFGVKVTLTGCFIIRRYINHLRLLLVWLLRLSHFFHILFVLFCIIVYMTVCSVCFCLILYKYL
jgi:hypothetical protein